MPRRATARPKGKRKRRTWRRRLLCGLLAMVALPPVGFLALWQAFPLPVERLARARREARAPVVLDREGRMLRPFLGENGTWMFWTPLERVSPRLVQATIAVEDHRFHSHPGVDPFAIVRAAWTNLRRGRIVSGASTLAMQLVRLLDRRPRTLLHKILEAFRALQLQAHLGRPRVLEWYLNLAPYGGNLVGVEAAARRYFAKHAADLTLGEAALLAGLPQSPSRLRPDRHPERARARRDHVLRRLRACGYITDAELAVALAEPILVVPEPFPFEAPHFARFVHQRHPGLSVVRTTLDRRIQRIALAALRQWVSGLRGSGVTNGAVVVIENQQAAVRALVGSCDFHALAHHGQVNGATAPRSPGSTIKPFLYALAFELGLCMPCWILADVPANHGGYAPENYDRRHRGPVPARQALAQSLNVPAVALLREVGVERLHAFLRQLGVSTLTREPSHYGLALALGSGEVTLLELTNAYAALARLGLYRPYRLLETEPLPPGRRVLSQGAAYLVADILADTSRLGGRPLWKSARRQPKMAWKTGTSFGHRDAWTIAYTPDYTVGVWVGNFSGKPSRELVGVRAAAPVAARVLGQIDGSGPSPWYRRPHSVEARTVCAVSGMPIGPHCPRAAEGLAVRGRSPGQPCTVHVAARIDKATGTCLCPACSRGRSYQVKVVERWPVALAAWLAQHQPHRALMPPHFAGCSRHGDDGTRPRILSPTAGQSYVLLEGERPSSQKLLLRAASTTDRLYWFIDGALFLSAAPAEPAFWPVARGPHRIVCSDAAGRSASVVIEVR